MNAGTGGWENEWLKLVAGIETLITMLQYSRDNALQ